MAFSNIKLLQLSDSKTFEIKLIALRALCGIELEADAPYFLSSFSLSNSWSTTQGTENSIFDLNSLLNISFSFSKFEINIFVSSTKIILSLFKSIDLLLLFLSRFKLFKFDVGSSCLSFLISFI